MDSQLDVARRVAGAPEVLAYLAYPSSAAFVCAQNGHLLWASPSCRAVLGYDPAHMVGRNAWDLLVHADDLEAMGRLRALLSDGDVRLWLRYLKGDGKRDWFELEALNREGLIVAMLRPVTDPTRRHFHGGPRSLAHVAGPQDGLDVRLRDLVRTAEVQAFLLTPATALYVCRRDGHILWASPSMKAVFGYDPQSLVGRNAWEIFPAKEDLALGARASALLNEGDLVVWLPLVTADGTRAWFRVDCMNRAGGVVLAFRREMDPHEQRFHYFERPKPRA